MPKRKRRVNKALLQGGARGFPKPELCLLTQAPKQKGLLKKNRRRL